MEKDRTIQSKKKQKIDAIEPSDEHFSWFDHLKRDESYAALLSCRQEDLGSSHAIKTTFERLQLDQLFTTCRQSLAPI